MKINKIFLGLVFVVMMMLPLVANASEKDFIKDYFNNKLEIPDAPYITETQYENQATQLRMYYNKTSTLQKLALDIQKDGEDKVLEKYNASQLGIFIQVDVKFNDGDWLSSKGEWDKIDSEGNINYGENIREWDLTFLNVDNSSNDNANKLLNFTQSWLTYFDLESEFNDYYKPFVKALKNEYDENYYVFDFKDTTITYRIRWCVKYLQDENKENSKYVLLTSDWSKETSIGKNGKQEKIVMPKKIAAPILSEFNLTVDEYGTGSIKYFFELDDSVYDAEKYKLIVNDSFEPYIIEAQVKVNDGKWEDISIANATWLNNGYKSASVGEKNELTKDDDVYLRVRIMSTSDESEHSEWSNVIGTKKIDGAKEKHKDDKSVIEKVKCKLCGICPFQPLDICLFIWIILLILILLGIVIIIKRKKNKLKSKIENS